MDYLHRLDEALHPLGRDRRRQLLSEIEDHIDRARAELVQESPASVHALLDRLGPVGDIAAEAIGDDPGIVRSSRTGVDAAAIALLRLGVALFGVGWLIGAVRSQSKAIDALAIALLAFGVFLFGVGGFIGGAVLWAPSGCRRRDKVIRTLLLPGGLGVALVVATRVFVSAFPPHEGSWRHGFAGAIPSALSVGGYCFFLSP